MLAKFSLSNLKWGRRPNDALQTGSAACLHPPAVGNPLEKIVEDVWCGHILPLLSIRDRLSLFRVRKNAFAELMPQQSKNVLQAFLATPTLPEDAIKLLRKVRAKYDLLGNLYDNKFVGRCYETHLNAFCPGTISPKGDRCLLLRHDGQLGVFIDNASGHTFTRVLKVGLEISGRVSNTDLEQIKQAVWSENGEDLETVLIESPHTNDGLISVLNKPWQKRSSLPFILTRYYGYKAQISADGRFLVFWSSKTNAPKGTARTVQIVDTKSGENINNICIDSGVAAIFYCFMPNSKGFCIGRPEGISIFDFNGTRIAHHHSERILDADELKESRFIISQNGEYAFAEYRKKTFLDEDDGPPYLSTHNAWQIHHDHFTPIKIIPRLYPKPSFSIVPFTSYGGKPQLGSAYETWTGPLMAISTFNAGALNFNRCVAPSARNWGTRWSRNNDIFMIGDGGQHGLSISKNGTIFFCDMSVQKHSKIDFPSRYIYEEPPNNLMEWTLPAVNLQQWSQSMERLALQIPVSSQERTKYPSTIIFWDFSESALQHDKTFRGSVDVPAKNSFFRRKKPTAIEPFPYINLDV